MDIEKFVSSFSTDELSMVLYWAKRELLHRHRDGDWPEVSEEEIVLAKEGRLIGAISKYRDRAKVVRVEEHPNLIECKKRIEAAVLADCGL